MCQQIKCEDEIIKELQDMSDEQILNLLKKSSAFLSRGIIMQKNEDTHPKEKNLMNGIL